MSQPETHNENNHPVPAPLKRRKINRISVLNEEFDLSLLILIAQKKWMLLVAIVLTALLGAVVYLRYVPRVYEESCLMQNVPQNTVNMVLNTSNDFMQNNEDQEAQAVEFMGSKVFLTKVFEMLPMKISYYTEGTFTVFEDYLNSPYVVDLDSDAATNFSHSKVYVQFNGIQSGRLSFNQPVNSKNYILFQCGQWCTTPLGKLKITVVSPSAIISHSGNLNKDVNFFRVNNVSDLVKYYSGRIKIKSINPEAKTIQITCSDYDDKKAADIANEIALLYISESLKKRQQSAENILAFVDKQLDTIYAMIKSTEHSLDTFPENKNRLIIENIRNTTATQLPSLDERIFNLELDQNMLLRAKDQLTEEGNTDPMKLANQLDVIDINGGGPLKSNLDKMSLLLNQRDLLLNDITPDNNRIHEIKRQIDNQKELIVQDLDALSANMDLNLKQLKDKRDELYSQEINSTNGSSVEYLRLQRELTIDEKYYDDLLDKKSEYAIAKAGFVPESQVLDSPVPGWVPVSPKKGGVILVALIIAITVSIIVLIFIYLFYNNITSVEEIERLIENPVSILGIIPKYTKDIPSTQIIVNQNPKSILAESFRSIRTNLQFIASGNGARIISITSTISGEGKTFVSVNLAGIIAYSGKKVIIIDLDMRRPSIHTSFGIDNTKGMSTLLIGKYDIHDVIQKSKVENLHIITAGPIPPNPSELVMSEEMDEILNKLKKMYDVIIIDNPPVGLVTDGIAMLRKADYPIFLMRVDYSKREFIYFIDRLYYENDFHNLSVILNGVDFKRQRYGYSYYKYGYYGYGYGYTYGHNNYYET